MNRIRRSLASCALCVALLQVGLLLGLAVVPCCTASAADRTAETHDCCPAGTHAPGQCPLHKAGASHRSECRMTCGHQTSGPVLLASGVLPVPVVTAHPTCIAAPVFTPVASLVTRSLAPVSPPPEAA